ncbi:MAG: hypothetical protein IPK16_31980 [Anaerolineales bacterium]|nr:hypothetical protein [Anaerolineales bacterium]
MSAQLLAVAQADSAAQLQEFASRLEGLSQAEVDRVFGNIIKYIKMATSSNFDYLTFVSSLVIVVVGAWLMVSPLAGALGVYHCHHPGTGRAAGLPLPCYGSGAVEDETWFYRRSADEPTSAACGPNYSYTPVLGLPGVRGSRFWM